MAGLRLRSVASAHGAPLRGATIDRGLSLLPSLPSMPEAVLPGPSMLDQLLAHTMQRTA